MTGTISKVNGICTLEQKTVNFLSPQTMGLDSMISNSQEEPFQGNVDTIGIDTISGWVVDNLKPDNRVTVQLWINKYCAHQIQATTHRPDVESVGIGDGYSGFEIDLKIPTLDGVELEGAEFELWMVSEERRRLLHAGYLPGAFERWNPAINELIIVGVHEYMLTQDNQSPPSLPYSINRGKPTEKRITEKLFQNCNPSKTIQLSAGVPELSKYTIFTRDRLNQHKVFDFEQDPRTAVDLLIWYLESYGASRKPYKVPLSKLEVCFCNEMIIIPGTRFSLTRLHYYFLLRNKPEENLLALLNDEVRYCNEIMEWVTFTCPALNIDDFGSPTEYMDFLKNISWEWKGKKFPINKYFTELYKKKKEWQCLDLTQEAHRGTLYLLALLENATKVRHVHFMPYDVKKSLLTEQYFLSKLNEHIISPYFGNSLDLDKFVSKLEFLHISSGYALKTGEYTSITQSGNRFSFANIFPKLTNEKPVDIQLIGPLDKASGLGQAARLSARMIESLDLNYNFVNFDLDNPAPEGFSSNIKHGNIKKAKINLIHLNAESIPFALAYSPDAYTGSYNIGYFFWELDTPALCHQLAIDVLDEIWVCSEYGVSQYRNSTSKPVINVGMSVEKQQDITKDSAKKYLHIEFGIDPETRVFLATFDSFSFVQRKNPLGVVHAFKQAFEKGENVCLILKTQNKNFVGDPVQLKVWKAVEYAIGGDSRIRLVNHTFGYHELLTLKKAADCYVSLHKSEGWGFGMIEAMNLEVPVVATNYSGNLEYCDNENSWLVNAHEKYLSESDYIFVSPGQKWVEPDIEHAALLLHDVYENISLASDKARLAKIRINECFSESVIAKRYDDRLKFLLKNISTT